jgi:hypothetical protein
MKKTSKPPPLPFNPKHPELGGIIVWIRYLEERVEMLERELAKAKPAATPKGK